MSQPAVSLLDVSTYLPGEPIGADYYAQFAGSDDLRDNLMFRAPKFRHHVAPDETAIDMVERAAAGLLERHGPDAVAGLSSARCVNEENYVFQKFMRVAVGTHNVDHCART